MSTAEARSDASTDGRGDRRLDMKLEVVVLPVSDVDRAKAFYADTLGWRVDADLPVGDDFRVVQLTPPGSQASIIFGTGVSSAKPGSAEGLHLVVDDIEATHAELVAHGVEAEIFHDAGGIFHHAGVEGREPGPDPQRRSYGSFASFSDPDGNGWVLQEIGARLPGRVTQATTYTSTSDLEQALMRAAAAHGKHEELTGEADEQWPAWYADYMVRERAGEELPT